MKTFKKLMIGLFIVLGLQGCNEDQDNAKKEGKITFNFGVKTTNSETGRVLDSNLYAVIVSISDANGKEVYSDHLVQIKKFGNGYVSEPLSLESGVYTVNKFMVIDANGAIVYATPLAGSLLANFVTNPLPYFFEIEDDEISELTMEVIATDDFTPKEFGYVSFDFNIVEIQNVLLSVLFRDENGNYDFVESELNVFVEDSILYSIHLGDSVNVIPLSDSFSQIILQVNYENLQKEILILGDSLDMFKNSPITIIFENHVSVDLDLDLIAYYPFNDGGLDESGNGHHAAMMNTTLVENRFGEQNKACSFNGYNSFMDLGILDTAGNVNQDFAVSFWIKMDEYAPGIQGAIISNRKRESSTSVLGSLISVPGEYYKYNGNIDLFGKASIVTGAGYFASGANSVDQVSLEVWNHIIISCKFDGNNSYVDIYINGALDSQQSFGGIVNSPNQPTYIGWEPVTNIPNDYHFNGILDDIRIYGRTLSTEDVNALHNETRDLNY